MNQATGPPLQGPEVKACGLLLPAAPHHAQPTGWRRGPHSAGTTPHPLPCTHPHQTLPSQSQKSKIFIVLQTLLKRDLTEKIYKAFKSFISREHLSLTGGVEALLFKAQG